MAETERKPDPTAAVERWLSGEPDADIMAELGALRTHLAACLAAAEQGQDGGALLRQLAVRTLDARGRLCPRLLDAALPLARELHQAAEKLVELLCDIAAALQRLDARRESRWLRFGRDAAVEQSGEQAFVLLSEAHVVLSMSGASAPRGFWRAVHALGGMNAAQDADEGVAGRLFLYRRMLAVAVAQPESLTPRESSWLFDYLDSVAMQAQLSHASLEPLATAYWIDLAADAPPAAVCRRQPPDGAALCYFSPVPLVPHAREHIEWLETRMIEAELHSLEVDGELLAPDVVGLPLGLAPAEILSLLRRLSARWATPPLREQPRLNHQYTVQVCVGLRSVWELGRGEIGAAGVAEWMVLNESPGGYAIMSVAGVQGMVAAGMVVALRRDAADSWAVCIVRWVRSDNPEQIEIGLQMMSQSFASILLGFRGNEVRTTSPGLMLPAMPPARRNAVILAPAGTYTSRRFVFVREGPPLYVAQGRALGLDMQTANVEMFQYETDPYAL